MVSNPVTSIVGFFVALSSIFSVFFPESQGTIATVGTVATGVGLALAKDGVGKGASK